MSNNIKSRKSVLITGSSGGIGEALCKTFRADGYFVIATDLVNTHDFSDVFISQDLFEITSDSRCLNEFLDRVKDNLSNNALHSLVNNAAIQITSEIEKIRIEDWNRSIAINLTAPMLLVQGLVKELQTGQGSVINISSIHASQTKPEFVTYATTKAALVGLTQALAIDLGSRVRVNAVLPAATATPMLLQGFAGKQELMFDLESCHPLGRIATPKEISEVVLFLASDISSFISGVSLRIDGGIGVRLHDPV
jgi:NAD(P)-dependent dehydrogenase (short-subunit alcohol dehydrogenase family)